MAAANQDSERGGALVIALLMMAVLMLLGGAFLTIALTESAIAANQVSVARAFHLAEAGLELARSDLAGVDVDATLEAGGRVVHRRSLGQGTYSLAISNNVAPLYPMGSVPADDGGETVDGDGYLVLTSTGTFRSATRSVQVVVKRGSLPGSEWALFGDYFLTARGAGSIAGQVGTNGHMYLRSDVIGDAYVGGTLNDNRPSHISGNLTMHAPRIRFSTRICPSGDYGLSPIGAGVDFNFVTGDLDINGDGDTVFPGGTYYFRDFTKTGDGEMLVAPGETVEIFIRRRLLINGNGFRNANNAAANLQIWGCGDNATMLLAAPEWRLSGDQETWLYMYAPNHPIRLLGDGTIHGSLIGKGIYKNSEGDVVYDTGLENAGAGSFAVVPGTWTEVFQ